MQEQKREQWASKIGLVLAMAGNAVGLGNFLRFPLQVAQYGGGTFMIPYIIAFIFLGLPIMLVEWGMGRFGGSKGQATMPGIFALIKNNKLYRLLGAIAIWIPLTISSYYCFIESWTLGYTFFSFVGNFRAGVDSEGIKAFYENYVSIKSAVPYLFFLATIVINGAILYKGISQGIEKAAKILMPLLFAFAIVLMIRVFTLGAPDPAHPDWNVLNGLGYIWNPDLTKLGDFRIWLAAAGQIFFTLSIGMGSIACYASYVKKDDDVVASGLTTALTNESAEVICGGSIAIPLAVAFFGITAVAELAKGSGFGFAFVTMPLMFAKIPFGNVFGAIWFFLLFFAGITSSLAMCQIVVAFFEELVGFSREKSVFITMSAVFVLAHIAIFLKGGLDEMDTLACNIGLTVFCFIELILWNHIFGIERSWKELMQGSKINLWQGIKWITAYVSPLYLLVIIVGWLVQDGAKYFQMVGVPENERMGIWITRGILLALFLIIGWFSTHNMHKTEDNGEEGTVQ